ncbi:30S ribosomal protein S11 [Patescibacteria group bacterium]|nr:30S ribosomal protein S11 [Patescibacteria group bacterium]MBU1703530.1 30S ribosomal protein S11 [Patescibacteria group bacterium]MBU1953437.1 30S ribosomal protein S11 [Patescibacteria group bacterium]
MEKSVEKTSGDKAPVKDEVTAETKAVEKTEKSAAPKKTKKKPKRRLVVEGKAYIQASFNNTIVSIADTEGQILSWSSAGANGFKGPKKATPYAAQVSAEKAAEKAKVYGVERVHVVVKGAGNGREQAIRGLQTGGINVESITDVTTIPHNGCRQKKSRRV